MVRTLIAGNWKMNGLAASLSEIRAVASGLGQGASGREALLCLPATLIASAADIARGSALKIGGQVCHAKPSGAHTGDLSAEMLADAGASHVICGHSERRADHGETNVSVSMSAAAALRAGLIPIICIGETLAERRTGKVAEVVLTQLEGSIPESGSADRLVIAYEPVWAIGTGETATPEQAGEVHTLIRSALRDRYGPAATDIPLLYGGSMNPGNAAGLLATPNINGGLIGGASLKAADFLSIYRS